MFTYFIKRGRETRNYSCSSRATTAKKCKRNVMHVQSCCFANLNLFFFPWSLPLLLPSSLSKLPIVVIQKFYYHGNVTSHFSLSVHSLWVLGRLERKKKRARGARRRGKREPNRAISLFPSIPARSLLFYWEPVQRSMRMPILHSVLAASRVTLPNRDGKIYIRDSDFKLPRLMSYLNCATITSVFLSTRALDQSAREKIA